MSMMTLVKRNMMLFFKDKTAVFFSLMAVFVVLGLYIAFLGDMMIQPLKASFGEHARELSDNWIMAGTLGTVCLTTSLSVLEIIIDDKNKRILDDFYITPMKKKYIALAYVISTFIITFMVCMITLLIAELYIVYYGGAWLSFHAFIKVIGVLCINILCCISILYFVLSFFRSTHAFSNVTTIIGTLSGFLMGIYIPIGSLPDPLQTIIRFFPPSHGASLLRKVMMQEPMETIFSSMPSEVLSDFRIQFGLDFYYGDIMWSSTGNLSILCLTAIFFLFLYWLKKKK